MSIVGIDPSAARVEELEAIVARMHAELATASEKLATASEKLAAAQGERDKLRRAYRELMEQFELLRRRIFIAKAERVDASQLELEFAETKQKLDALALQLEQTPEAPAGDADIVGNRPSGKPAQKPRPSPKGRRNLAADVELPERRIEIRDAELEKTGTFIGWEESYKYGFQKPGPVRIVLARAKYRVESADSSDASADPATASAVRDVTILTAAMPRLLIKRGLLAPSLLARIIVMKFRFGMPYFRQEEQLGADGIQLARSTMARSIEDVGASLGPIVMACADDARKNAFCLSTDATGVSIRPEPLADSRKRQPCRKGHLCAAGHKK